MCVAWSIFEYENSFITTTREEINGVPCLKFKPKGYEGLLPTVIYYHGWHSSKDFIRFEAQVIASNGYQVIVPDALHHGDRDAIDHDNPQNLEIYLWKIILQSVKESKKFIEEIVNDHEADATRIGIMGSSMGAITAGGIFIHNPDAKCLVGFNGIFAWQEAIKINHLPSTSEGNMELIKQYDPMNNGDVIKERAILILHGTEDTSVPIESQRLFFNKMIPLYIKDSKKLGFIEEANVNHRVTAGMLQEAVTWFKKYL
jgi:dienelactone hydrolase